MNPYMPYREPEERRNRKAETLSSILAALKLGLEGYNVYQTGEINKERNALTAKELEMRGAETVENRALKNRELGLKETEIAQGATRNTILQQQADQAGEANRIKTGESPDLKNFGVVSAKVAENHLMKLGVKQDSPIIQNIQEMAKNPEVNNGTAYKMLLNQYPAARQEMLDSMADDYTKKLEKYQKEGKDYTATTEGRSQLQAIEAIETDQTGEKVLSQYFPGTAESMKAREAESAKKAYIPPERPVSVPPGGSLVDTTGNPIYTAPAKAERPVSVPPGATLIDPTTQKTIYTAPPKAERPVSVPEGGTLIDPATGKPIYTAPKTPAAAKGPTPADKRAQDNMVAKAETLILSNKDKEAAGANVDLFNQNAQKPYAYQWKKGTLYGGEWAKIPLPTIKGKQVTAAEVYFTAEQNGITYDEVLRRIGAIK